MHTCIFKFGNGRHTSNLDIAETRILYAMVYCNNIITIDDSLHKLCSMYSNLLHSYAGNRPTLGQLHSIIGINKCRYNIIQECAGQWKQLADFLLDSLSATLTEEIAKDASLPTPSDKCRAVFKHWLDGKPNVRQPVTWKELLTVLGDLEKGVLVDDLTKFVFQQE